MRLWLGLAISLAFLGLLLWQFDLSQSQLHIRRADPFWLMWALLALTIGFSVRIGRWRLLLSHFTPHIRWRDVAGPFLGSFALNNVVPLRAGDIARAFAFKQELDTDSSLVTSTLIVERVLDLASLLIILLAGLILLPADSELAWINYTTYGLLTLALTGVLLVLATPHWWKKLFEMSPLKNTRAGHFIVQVLEGLEVYRGWTLWLSLLSLSLVAWLVEGLVYLCACLALSTMPAFVGPWFAMAVGSLGTLIPSSPGYIGTFDYFATLAFTSTGLTDGPASSAAILVHLLLWLPITLIGGAYLLRHWGSAFGKRMQALRNRKS
jgi:uncharacterized protein (TIRG00374 family)